MAKVIWSPSALVDIELIMEYISRDSVSRASLFMERLIAATDRLKTYPFSGRVIPEIGQPTCREILYGAFRIMYRIDNDEVWITGVVHSARDWKPE